MHSKLLLIAGLLTGSVAATAGAPAPTDEEHELQAESMRLVHRLMSDQRFAMRARPLDASVAPTFAAYIDALDPQRLYFTNGDLHDLDDARAGIGAAIQGKDLAPAHSIFAAFVARVAERSEFARARLAEPADYAIAGSWVPDRGALPRVADQAQLDETWRRLVRNDRLELHLAGQSDEEIGRTLDARYADLLRRMRELRADEAFATFADAYVSAVDSAGDYHAPREPLNNLGVDPERIGVGMTVSRDFPFSVVQGVVPGGPADLAGVRPGERIVAISEETGGWTDTVGQRMDAVVLLLRGRAGTHVRLRLVSPAGAAREVQLTRAAVTLADEVATASIVAAGIRRIGVIKLPAFYLDYEARRRGEADARASATDVARLLGELQTSGVDGVLLDLRGNGGGALTESVEIAALFVGRRPIVQIREGGGRATVQSGAAKAVWKGPLAVLVDSQSAAASEIVAAALQDHGRATVLGERTFGRGTVQSLVDLAQLPGKDASFGGMVKFTIAEFFRVDGRSIETVGVEPDAPLPEASAAAPPADVAPAARRIPAAPDFESPPARPKPASTAIADDPTLAAWRDRWQRARAVRSANEVALDATTRRAAIASEQADVEAAGARDDALQAAALVFAGELGNLSLAR